MLPWNTEGCLQCKEPLKDRRLPYIQRICGHCLTNPPAFKATTAELLYQDPIIELIHDFKFNFSPRAGTLLVELMLANAPIALGDVLLPVPMFRSRARARGFNQAHWLANQLGQRLNLPVINAVCTRRLPSQRSLNRRQREENLLGAFQVQGPLPDHVTIVDDVVTTGATGQALAVAALSAGAKQIGIWAVARTPLDKSC
ncbi:ComF family protein [Vreelandella olivaria]|uniref:ComF family protein n=1 Tax=Vreelandella olivaria TaxID=390919 RepID=UPI00201EC54D|nr:ComF family protein [Halomonas olivaria]